MAATPLKYNDIHLQSKSYFPPKPQSQPCQTPDSCRHLNRIIIRTGLIAIMLLVIFPFMVGEGHSNQALLLAENSEASPANDTHPSSDANKNQSSPSLLRNPGGYIDLAKDAASKEESRQKQMDETFSMTD